MDKIDYNTLINQAHKCDSIAREAKTIKLIMECKDLSLEDLEAKLNALNDTWHIENDKFKQYNKTYEDMKKREKQRNRFII